jgi:hypothetical protein
MDIFRAQDYAPRLIAVLPAVDGADAGAFS